MTAFSNIVTATSKQCRTSLIAAASILLPLAAVMDAKATTANCYDRICWLDCTESKCHHDFDKVPYVDGYTVGGTCNSHTKEPTGMKCTTPYVYATCKVKLKGELGWHCSCDGTLAGKSTITVKVDVDC